MERKFTVRKFRKFGYSSRYCPLFPEISENVVPFAGENVRKFKPAASVELKVPQVSVCRFTRA